jgi:hypothetical protein
MRDVPAILREDLKHLWPLATVVSAILILHGWIDFRLERGFVTLMNTRWVSLEPLVLTVTWWCLVGVLVQRQRLPGHRRWSRTPDLDGNDPVGR